MGLIIYKFTKHRIKDALCSEEQSSTSEAAGEPAK